MFSSRHRQQPEQPLMNATPVLVQINGHHSDWMTLNTIA